MVAKTADTTPLAQRAFSSLSPEVGAVCGNSARTDLHGGVPCEGHSYRDYTLYFGQLHHPTPIIPDYLVGARRALTIIRY